jgi:hypothetical protein
VVEQTFGLLNWYRRLSKDDRWTILTSLFNSISLASSAFKKPKIIFVHISRLEHY